MNKEKLAERLDKLEEENQKLKEDIKKLKREKSGEDRQENISCRNFLKKIAGGAAGIGVLSMLPNAAAFQVKSPEGFSLHGNRNQGFNIDTQEISLAVALV